MAEPLRAGEWNAIWDAITANRTALDACRGHDFLVPISPVTDTLIGKQWQCGRCGGQVSTIEKFWYDAGVAHAAALMAPADG